MKTIYTSQGYLFATKDLAIVCCNDKNVIAVEVPENTFAFNGTIEINIAFNKQKGFIIDCTMENDFDQTYIVDYCPEFSISLEPNHDDWTMDLDDVVPVSGVNYEFSDLSEELQEQIKDWTKKQYENEQNTTNLS